MSYDVFKISTTKSSTEYKFYLENIFSFTPIIFNFLVNKLCYNIFQVMLNQVI